MRVKSVYYLAVVLMLASAGVSAGENWPQWRGPNLNGTSGEKNLGEVDGGRERRMETRASGFQRLDAGHLGRAGFLERRRWRRPVALVRGQKAGRAAVEETAWRGQQEGA